MYKLEEELDERKQRAILLLLEGRTISEIAEEMGVSRMTLYRWKNNDQLFQEELRRLKQSAWEAGESKLIAARAEAIEATIELLAHEDARIRLKAIDTILRFDIRRTWAEGPLLSPGRRE
jgi:transposase-like protein